MKLRVRHISMPWNVGTVALTAGILLMAVASPASTTSAQSPDISAQSPDVSDCFGGALSADAIHCEVFEWAHNEGVIEVAAVYRAGRALYIYLTQADRLNDAALEKMLAKSQEVARRTGEHRCVLDTGLLCGSGVVYYRRGGGYILPDSSVYKVIEVFPGGAEARRKETGWRAFQQLWPTGAGGVTGASDEFDISGTDRTNFPTLTGNCDSLVIDLSFVNTACRVWDWYPSLGVANVYDDTWNDKAYIYVKAKPGEEKSKIAAARTVLINSQIHSFTESNLVVVAVPHDFEEMWRWSLILDRFADSDGNTLGITNARLDFNDRLGLSEDTRYVFPSAYAPDLTDQIRKTLGFRDGLRWRMIIHVPTLDFDRTVAGMPKLLEQLGIPAYAVGLIYEEQQGPVRRGRPLPDVDSPGDKVLEVEGWPEPSNTDGELNSDQPSPAITSQSPAYFWWHG